MLIDLHGHCTPRVYLEALERREQYPRARSDGDDYRIEVSERLTFHVAPNHWDLAARLPVLDAGDVAIQVLSLSAAYGFDRLAGDEAVQVAEAVNQALIEAVKPHGDRFRTLAIAPIDAGSSGVAVLTRALASGHCGMMLSASTVAQLDDDGILRPYLQQVQATRGIVLVHPGSRVNTAGLPNFAYSVNTAAFQNELTVALFRLVYGGLFDAMPELRLVFVNLGGAAPLLAERMRSMWENRQESSEPPDTRFRRVYYDFSSFREHSLEAAVAVLGADRIVFGTDYPIQGLFRPRETLRNARISDPERNAISSGNAERLLRRTRIREPVRKPSPGG